VVLGGKNFRQPMSAVINTVRPILGNRVIEIPAVFGSELFSQLSEFAGLPNRATPQWDYVDLKRELEQGTMFDIGHCAPDHRWFPSPEVREELRLAALYHFPTGPLLVN
jgi:hypothetical protein